MLEEGVVPNGVIVHSDLLLDYLKTQHPKLYFVSSTTKVLTGFDQLEAELNRPAYQIHVREAIYLDAMLDLF